jgi:hypothetical protein
MRERKGIMQKIQNI